MLRIATAAVATAAVVGSKKGDLVINSLVDVCCWLSFMVFPDILLIKDHGGIYKDVTAVYHCKQPLVSFALLYA